MITNILDYLEESSRNFPLKVAFKDENKSITFSELVFRAKCIGTSIAKDTGNALRSPVCVFVDRNVESIVSFMGIIYSGNFYVPVDSRMPWERIKLIFDNLEPCAAINTTREIEETLRTTGYAGKLINFSEASASAFDEDLLRRTRLLAIDVDPLYAIFTSGSTGMPKGVVISHKSVIDLTEWLVETFKFRGTDILGNQTPFFFDASVKDIYITIKTGATMCILERKYFLFPVLLIEYLNTNRITSILWATSAICLVANSKVLAETKPLFLNKVFFAGEAMPAKQFNIWKFYVPDAQYINLYGPTEITVDCTFFIVNREFSDDEFIPIGYPCRNIEVLILNDKNELINNGSIGELCVRGTGLALGYYNAPEKTNEVFIQDPRHNHYPDKIYKTGDLVRINEMNEIVFVARKDFQIKHLGNRIELGEIEAAVNSIRLVTNAACIYDPLTQRIILFYTSGNNEKININKELIKKLPKYMLPSSIIHLSELPYNNNGKVDRQALKDNFLNEGY